MGVSEGVGGVRDSATVSKGRGGSLAGEMYPRHEKQTKNPAERTGSRYKIEILMSRTRKLKGLAAASLGVKTFDDNPYLKFQSI